MADDFSWQDIRSRIDAVASDVLRDQAHDFVNTARNLEGAVAEYNGFRDKVLEQYPYHVDRRPCEGASQAFSGPVVQQASSFARALRQLDFRVAMAESFGWGTSADLGLISRIVDDVNARVVPNSFSNDGYVAAYLRDTYRIHGSLAADEPKPSSALKKGMAMLMARDVANRRLFVYHPKTNTVHTHPMLARRSRALLPYGKAARTSFKRLQNGLKPLKRALSGKSRDLAP